MTATDFTYDALPGRIVFGAGRVSEAADEARRLGSRVLLVHEPTEKHLADPIMEGLGDSYVGTFDEIRQHVPVEVAETARARVRETDADVLLTIGGGSCTGFAKAVALELNVRILAVATTYAGSEVTPIWGMTESGKKTTGRDIRVLPATVVYDPELTVTLPRELSATSGLNALAHAVEALYAPGANPITSLVAVESIRALASGLPRVVLDGADLDARSKCLYGAYLAGTTLAVAGTSIHHKICHVLGGAYDLPHSPTHAALLPYVIAAIADRIPDALPKIADGLGAEDAVAGLFELQDAVGAPTTLREVGMAEAELDPAAERAAVVTQSVGIPMNRAEMADLLGDAYHGSAVGTRRSLDTTGDRE
ncbi:MAG: maleylacetate reductase [Actinobacteria bacterium]|nr:maleylacetate reductase [Actinomycetota bacterium]